MNRPRRQKRRRISGTTNERALRDALKMSRRRSKCRSGTANEAIAALVKRTKIECVPASLPQVLHRLAMMAGFKDPQPRTRSCRTISRSNRSRSDCPWRRGVTARRACSAAELAQIYRFTPAIAEIFRSGSARSKEAMTDGCRRRMFCRRRLRPRVRCVHPVCAQKRGPRRPGGEHQRRMTMNASARRLHSRTANVSRWLAMMSCLLLAGSRHRRSARRASRCSRSRRRRSPRCSRR